jgi:hypothetical protein
MNSIIKIFYNQISWADECSIVQIDGIEFVQSNSCLYLPCHYKHVEPSARITSLSAERLKLEPALIVWGNPTKDLAQQIYSSETKRGILVVFVDAIAKVAQSQFIVSALDGIDWQRTSEGIAQGGKQLVWEWD